MLGLIIVAGLVTALIVARGKQNTLANQTASDFTTQSIPLAELNSAGAITLNGRVLNVNGQLRANGSLIMTPAAQPSVPATGELYYDQTSNHLKYYNGTDFVQIQTDKDATGSGSTTNNITNLSVVNNVVTTGSLGGTTGKIAKFTSGQTLGNSILTDSGTFLTVGGGVNINASTSTSDLSFWPESPTPAHLDTNDQNGSVELGAKFQVDVPGTIKAIKFYKATTVDSVPITVSLRTSAGTLLAQTTVTETGTGWKLIPLPNPVSISPDTTYVASYFIPSTVGQVTGYAFDQQYFGAASVDNGPLHALASGLDGGNGVFKYTATSALPNQTFNSTNYWVDVVFTGSQFTDDSRIRINGAQISSSDLANDNNIAKRGSSQVFSGHNIFRNASDSSDEFTIQKADTTQLLTVNSQDNVIYVGPVGGAGNTTLLVLGNRTTSGDPGNVNEGAMYYNAIDGVFRCFSSGAWSNCNDISPSHSFSQYDEFMGGQTTSFGTNNIIGNLGWNAQAIGANGSINFNPTTPTPVADRPGVLALQTPAVANQGTSLILGNSNGDSMLIRKSDTVHTSVAIGAITGQVLRVGLHNETTATTQPVSGVWWEADPAVSSVWRYCYGNGTTATCTNSGTTIAANTWVTLSIYVNNTGTGTSDVSFNINSSAYNVNTTTVDTTNRVSPAYSCYSTNGSAQTCYWDYFQLTGVTSVAR